MDRPLRVAHVNVARPQQPIDPEALLRAWPTLRDVATAVRHAGAEVTVLQSFHADAELVEDGVRYRFIREPLPPGRLARLAPWRIVAAARSLAADVIHLNGFEFPCHARFLCGLGAPVLVQDHSSRLQMRFPIRRSWGYRRIAGAAFTSAESGTVFLAGAGLPEHIRVFEIPESSTHFTPGDRNDARAHAEVSGDPMLLWVGRLNANKDPLTVLAAAEIALRHLPGLQLWCCFGEDDLLAQVHGFLANRPKLAAHVHLLGRLPHDQIERLCRAADFFVLGSAEEGSGYALIEAMACGAAPIVSDIPAFRTLTGDGAVGRLVPRGDAKAFAGAIVALSGADRDQLKADVLGHFASNLSFDVVGTKLVAAYRSLVASAGRR